MSTALPLSFHDVDGLAFAAARGRFDPTTLNAIYTPRSLGPLMELLHLAAGARLPDPLVGTWFRANAAAGLVGALRGGREGWVCPRSRRIGFIRARRDKPDGDHRLTKFLMVAQQAANEMAGLPGSVPGQLVSAMEELENNIHEHAGAPHTGVIAFRATAGIFEFVASDRGIGVLESLRSCATYADLPDAGKALEAALTEGVSKHGPGSRHGNGFRPIFIGLMNLRGLLRFRSGDHALTMDGSSPELSMARIAQKPPIDGFFASVTCYAKGPSSVCHDDMSGQQHLTT